MQSDTFSSRHIGPRGANVQKMLDAIGVDALNTLIDQTVPAGIRYAQPLPLGAPLSEFEYSNHIASLAARNKVFRSFIGQGYYGTVTPAVIRRNIFENPGWYTAYTPYQAEISQGRLEALLNYQTMVSDLTGMEISNASLLDEGTAAAEAMIMMYHARSRDAVKAGVNKFFIDESTFVQTIDVIKTRAYALDIVLEFGDYRSFTPDASYFGAMVQYPSATGEVHDFRAFAAALSAHSVRLVVAADLLSLALLTPPGEWGADVVVGNSQRFGVPMGFGGPHAGYFACREEFKREMPGRIIGVSVDADGNPALRMALQTREQHIKRDKATSNICTAQALLAIMAGMYAAYHGPNGIRHIAQGIHSRTTQLAAALRSAGYKLRNTSWFDTITLEGIPADKLPELRRSAESLEINLCYHLRDIRISLDETTSDADIENLCKVFGASLSSSSENGLPSGLMRSSEYLTHPVFNSYHSESEMMRYIKVLENKDISLTRSMITLGSCTMKLNAASEMYPVSLPAFSSMHPFAPTDQTQGYMEVINTLEQWLCAITGFAGISFQPNSGAQGEYAGLLVIRAWHESRGEGHRNVALIPSSAHGTNPASAVMAGMEVVVVKCDDMGNVDIADLREKATQHAEKLSCLMVTYPSTHGVFEEGIREITDIIHQNGGQVYMDGANMNAQVGLTSPGNIGADVCHLNLHKTFAIPHGGGGPGVGPIGVAAHLKPFLPGHSVVKTGGEKAIHAVSSAPYGSASILLISYGYCRMLGGSGVTDATRYAILNANYIKARLSGHYDILYVGTGGRVAHEMILDCRNFKKTAGIEVVDIAKRLIDFGYHAPTVSFPVAGTLMIEPTESEAKIELDRFCDALIQIRKEIRDIEEGKADVENNVLHHAPHKADLVVANNWNRPYSREQAAFPLPWVRENKYWSPVSRVDNAYGDRNLVCACPPIEEYMPQI